MVQGMFNDPKSIFYTFTSQFQGARSDPGELVNSQLTFTPEVWGCHSPNLKQTHLVWYLKGMHNVYLSLKSWFSNLKLPNVLACGYRYLLTVNRTCQNKSLLPAAAHRRTAHIYKRIVSTVRLEKTEV